jgi:hypothetical protein
MSSKITKIKPSDPEKQFELQSEAIIIYRQLHFGFDLHKPNIETAELVKNELEQEIARWPKTKKEQLEFLKIRNTEIEPSEYIKALKYLHKILV